MGRREGVSVNSENLGAQTSLSSPRHPVSPLTPWRVTFLTSFPVTFPSAPRHQQKLYPDLHVQTAVLTAAPRLLPPPHQHSVASLETSSPSTTFALSVHHSPFSTLVLGQEEGLTMR